MKKCTKCGEQKAAQAFYSDSRNRDGLQSQCRVCGNTEAKARYATDPQAKEKRRIQAQRWAEANPERRREIRRKHNWAKQGIAPWQATALLDAHDGKCALCGSDSSRAKHGWHIDHDHRSGKVRGVLCHHCNVGLGRFGDDPALLMKAAEYIKGHQEVA